MKKKITRKMQRRHKLNKECLSLVYEILYAKTGKTASYGAARVSFSRYLNFFGFKQEEMMKTEEVVNFRSFLAAVNKQARALKQLPFK